MGPRTYSGVLAQWFFQLTGRVLGAAVSPCRSVARKQGEPHAALRPSRGWSGTATLLTRSPENRCLARSECENALAVSTYLAFVEGPSFWPLADGIVVYATLSYSCGVVRGSFSDDPDLVVRPLCLVPVKCGWRDGLGWRRLRRERVSVADRQARTLVARSSCAGRRHGPLESDLRS